MRHDAITASATAETARAWYLEPAALSLLAAIRANPPKRAANFETIGRARAEWHAYEGGAVDALKAIRSARFRELDATRDVGALATFYADGDVQAVIAAVLDAPLPGVHFTFDRERLATIRDAVGLALVGQGA